MPWKPQPKDGEPTPQEKFRDAHQTTIICGVDGCRHKRSGPFGKVRELTTQHRTEKHPEWEPPVYKTKGRRRIRVK